MRLTSLVITNLFFILILACTAKAQDTLPAFTVENKGNGRIVVSWANPYPNLIQLAVQRSYDSVKRFGTVYSTTSPELPVNGFSDKIPEGVTVFYRIFYVMEGGSYFFTPSQRPPAAVSLDVVQTDTRREILDEDLQKIADAKNKKQLDEEMLDPNKILYIKMSDTTDFRELLYKDFRLFRDSIMTKTKDTLVQIGEDTLFIRAYDPPFTQRSSQYIFTDKDGYIVIKLDDAGTKKYQVTFMEEDGSPLLDIKQVKHPYLILDKTNFYKAGWYKYSLKENGRVKENGVVFLPRDFGP